jgi:DNA-directed RNA polymerase I subunit RPA2
LQINVKTKLIRDAKHPSFDTLKFRDIDYIKKSIESGGFVCAKMDNFLATGNLISRTNLDMMQTSGYTIVADKLN